MLAALPFSGAAGFAGEASCLRCCRVGEHIALVARYPPCFVDSSGAAGFSSAAGSCGAASCLQGCRFPAGLDFLALSVGYGAPVPASTWPSSHDILVFRGESRRRRFSSVAGLLGTASCLRRCRLGEYTAGACLADAYGNMSLPLSHGIFVFCGQFWRCGIYLFIVLLID